GDPPQPTESERIPDYGQNMDTLHQNAARASGAYAGSPLLSITNWLRGADLNRRPSGYECKNKSPSLPFNDSSCACLTLFHAVLFPICSRFVSNFEVLVLRLRPRVALDWEMAGPSFDRYPAEIGELGYDCLTTEAAVSAGFDSAEGH